MSWGRSTALLRLALISILAQTGALADAQVKYKVMDIGPFSPTRIGQGGMAAGRGNGNSYAWDAIHGTTEIPGLQGVYSAFDAKDVNAKGEVVGYDYFRDQNGSSARSFIWDYANGTREFAHFGINKYGLPVSSRAAGTNDLGQIVGDYDPNADSGFDHAYLFHPGQGWVDLPALPGHKAARAEQINNLGQVMGYSASGDGTLTPIMWKPDGSIEELGNLLNQRQNFLGDINDLGAICGGSYGPLQFAGYFRSTSGIYSRILNPYDPTKYTQGFGLNNANHVVGQFYDGADQQGFVWTLASGTMGINALLDSSAFGWDVINSLSINDSGQIVGVGRFNGGPQRGVLLEPVPEPSTIFVGIPLAWMLSRRSRNRRT